MGALTAVDVARITGKPLANVQRHLPLILRECERNKITSPLAVVAVIATTAVEGPFAPINEYGNNAYFVKNYWEDESRRNALGNTSAEAAVMFHGRGFVQLTGENNYKKYSAAAGVDLHKDPDKANDPLIAAKILVAYIRDHGVDVWAQRGNWRKVRTLVNGGINGWEYFAGGKSGIVWKLLELAFK